MYYICNVNASFNVIIIISTRSDSALQCYSEGTTNIATPPASTMHDPKSPHPPILSPSSSTLFSDVELSKPIKIKFTSSFGTSTPTKVWKDAAHDIEAQLRIFPS